MKRALPLLGIALGTALIVYALQFGKTEEERIGMRLQALAASLAARPPRFAAHAFARTSPNSSRKTSRLRSRSSGRLIKGGPHSSSSRCRHLQTTRLSR